MDKNYDFTAVPHGYALCLYPSCTHSEKCIRHLLTSHLPSDMEYLSIINPKCTGTDCRYFAPTARYGMPADSPGSLTKYLLPK